MTKNYFELLYSTNICYRQYYAKSHQN